MKRAVAFLVLVGAGLGAAWAQPAPTLADSPDTAAAFGRIEQYLLTESALGGRRARLLTLVTARELNLAKQWSVHEDAARAAGLEPAILDVTHLERFAGGEISEEEYERARNLALADDREHAP